MAAEKNQIILQITQISKFLTIKMNKALAILLSLTVLLSCTMAIQFQGPQVCNTCGNGLLNLGEGCDDGNTVNGNGCNSQCQIQVGYTCAGTPSICSLIPSPLCGNGIRDAGEQCDNGNIASGDGCTSNCLIEPGFICLDQPSPPALQNAPDQCTLINFNICGNGLLQIGRGQTCDDGNRVPGDGCGSQCIVQTFFACVGELNSLSTCVSLKICGNFILQPFEQCDNGRGAGCTACVVQPGYICSKQLCDFSNCFYTPICGDGVRNAPEECDAGLINDPGCSAITCKITPGYTCVQDINLLSTCKLTPRCGNRFVETGEQCDNGNTTGCINCLISPNYTCIVNAFGASACFLCGNSIVQGQQQCDNGNVVGCLGCTRNIGYFCQTVNQTSVCIVSVCGNGLREAPEQCDNGNQIGCFSCQVQAGYTCFQNTLNQSQCFFTTCGNGIREGIEACDNFNSTGCLNCVVSPGYTCTQNATNNSRCTLNAICGNGGKEGTEQCDNGNRPGCVNCIIQANYSCVVNSLNFSICTLNPFCGDRVRQITEQCDNGNLTGCIGCVQNLGFVCFEDDRGFSTCVQSVCGNSIIEKDQACDNGRQAGCLNCSVAIGYTCTNFSTSITVNTSVCVLTPRCGDGIRQQPFQSCDNGNITGCINCTVDFGYTCEQGFLGNSICYLAVCGNRIKEDSEVCDNGNRTGCLNCLVDPGFVCQTNAAGASVCVLTTTCGNQVREGAQQCDNGNVTGCINCTVGFGFECIQNIRKFSICTTTICGDSIKQQGQGCDNGNKTGCINCTVDPGYGCTQSATGLSTCVLVGTCGNVVVEANQQCDNGNKTGCINCTVDPGFTCPTRTSCVAIASACGNYVRQLGEECDNGGFLGCRLCKVQSGFTCTGPILSTSTCSKTFTCGDGQYQPTNGQQCDDGNVNPRDGCSSQCQVQSGYSCIDRGVGKLSVCKEIILAGCGDGSLNFTTEQCDDRNNLDFDGCSKYCKVQSGYTCQTNNTGTTACVLTNPIPGCGDGVVDINAGQRCDDNNKVSYDGCSANCQIQWGWECREVGSPWLYSICTRRCGNNYYEPTYDQQCDDGNPYTHDGCNGRCEIEDGWQCLQNVPGRPSKCFLKATVSCGNGLVEPGQSCDDGYKYSGDGCSSTCQIQAGWKCTGSPSSCYIVQPNEYCGDGKKSSSEQCDDRNNNNGDGCNANCIIENGWNCTISQIGGISKCVLTIAPYICGNGIKEPGEQCDDGNTNQNDACSYCRIVYVPPTPPTPPQGRCGDGIYQPNLGEQCDNGNKPGCLHYCQVDSGWKCINFANSPSYCEAIILPKVCGNGKLEVENHEECDDGNNIDGDGCERNCWQTHGYICQNQIGGISFCYYPYTCKYSNYIVPYVKLTPATVEILNRTGLRGSQTILDLLKALISYNQTNPVINGPLWEQLKQYRYAIDSTEWGIITYHINACTGWTSL